MDLAPALQEAVEDGNVMRLFMANTQSTLRVVDFGVDPPVNDFQHNKYRIMLDNDIPKGVANVVCVFPGHSKKTKRFLQTSAYGRDRDGFNLELNRRFSATPEVDGQFKDKRFMVLYGSHCFFCKNITGSIMLVWAEYVTRINTSNVNSIPYKHVPIILNCDRKATVKAMYILKPLIENKPTELSLLPRARGNPVLLWHKRFSPFVCESRPDNAPEPTIHAVSKDEALSMVTQSTQDVGDWLHFERIPFSSVQMGEHGVLEIETATTWTDSPREMFSNNVVGEGNWQTVLIKEEPLPPRLSRTGGGIDEPDPFVSDNDEEEFTSHSVASRGVEIELDDI